MSSGQGRRRKFNEEEQYEESIKRAKTPADVQRLRLEKLMKNPDKPIVLPNPKKEWKPPPPPEFVRNVVGSSAGAGSGEYHIYRNLRKRELLRQEFIAKETEKETMDKAYEERVEQKQKEAEAKTAKKRAKRLKRKMKAKQKHKKWNEAKGDDEEDETDEEQEDEASKEEPSGEVTSATNEDSSESGMKKMTGEGEIDGKPSVNEDHSSSVASCEEKVKD